MVGEHDIPLDVEGLAAEGAFFRFTPKSSAMLPLIKAVALRLAHGAPKLASLELRCENDSELRMWFINFTAPGRESLWQSMDPEETDVRRARVYLHTGDWRPDTETMELLKHIGNIRYGEDSAVIFLPQSY